MKRLNVLDFFSLGEQLGNLNKLVQGEAKLTRGQVFFAMIAAQESIKSFIAQDVFSLARDDARELNRAIDEFISSHVVDPNPPQGGRRFQDFNEEMQSWTYYGVTRAVEHLTHVFQSECRTAETYFIERKLIYDTAALLRRASEKIHESVRGLVEKDALNEIDESGRCLALEAYTASGFHALRGLELVMAAYYEAMSKKTAKLRSWSDYVDALGPVDTYRSHKMVAARVTTA